MTRLRILLLALVVLAFLLLACDPPTPIVNGEATATVRAQSTKFAAEGWQFGATATPQAKEAH